MRAFIVAGVALALVCGVNSNSHAAPAKANACKECSDHRKRCMRNYPGPTCKIDYDICVKNCGQK